ncbi:hypothetical protein HK405_016052, partial [Cladochytrium tenue]
MSSAWVAHTQPDGKVYYFNSATGTSTWQKPDELKTPLERALDACQWKEFKTEAGKSYYSNKATKETVWDMPAEYKEILDRFEKQPAAAPPQPAVHSLPPPPVHAAPVAMPVMSLPAVPSIPSPHPMPATPPVTAATVAAALKESMPEFLPTFDTKEEATVAFKECLAEAGVGVDWTWEQTMRAVISKPMYRALKTLSERKQAFQDYIDEKRHKEREAEREKYERERNGFRSLLYAIPDINGSTRYKRVCAIVGSDPLFSSIAEKMRMDLFEEFIDELRAKEKEDQRVQRKERMEHMRQLLRDMHEITAETPWREARQICLAHLQADGMPDTLDALGVFEDHVKALEAKFHELRSAEIAAQRREERRNRDRFRAVLGRLAEAPAGSGGGEGGSRGGGAVRLPPVHAGAKWKDVYPLFKHDPAYRDMLGQPGSTPLELFWDMVAELDRSHQGERAAVLDVVRGTGLVVGIDSSFDDFLRDFMGTFRDRPCPFSKITLKLVFDEFMSKAVAKQKEERRRQERRTRKKMDAFKYTLKKLTPPVAPGAQWAEVRELVKDSAEFGDLDEEQRVEVFERFLRRLKEKADDSGSDENDGGGGDGSGSRRKRRHRDERDDRAVDRDRDRADRDRDSDRGSTRDRERDRDRNRDRDRDRDRNRRRHGKPEPSRSPDGSEDGDRPGKRRKSRRSRSREEESRRPAVATTMPTTTTTGKGTDSEEEGE